VAQRDGVRLPARLPELIVDQQPRVRLVEIEVAGGLRGGGDELNLLRRRRRRGRSLFRLERQRFIDRALLLCDAGLFIRGQPCVPSLLRLTLVPLGGGIDFGEARLQLLYEPLQLGCIVPRRSRRDESDRQVRIAPTRRVLPDAKPMTELDRLKRIAALTLRVVRRLVPRSSELVENVEDLARGRSVDLERPEDIHEGGLPFDRKTGMLRNQGRQTLADLTCLYEGRVRIVDKVSLREAAKCRKTGVERIEVIEIAGSIHLQNVPKLRVRTAIRPDAIAQPSRATTSWMRVSLGIRDFCQLRPRWGAKRCGIFRMLNLFTLTPEVNRFGENGPREREFQALYRLRGEQCCGYNPRK